MADEQVFVFMDQTKKNQIDNLVGQPEAYFMKRFLKLVARGPFSFEIMGMYRDGVLMAINYLTKVIEKNSKFTTNKTVINVMSSNKANHFIVEEGMSSFSGFRMKKEKHARMSVDFCMELISYDWQNGMYEWIIYDKWYNKLFAVRLCLVGYENVTDLRFKSMAACLPGNHF